MAFAIRLSELSSPAKFASLCHEFHFLLTWLVYESQAALQFKTICYNLDQPTPPSSSLPYPICLYNMLFKLYFFYLFIS